MRWNAALNHRAIIFSFIPLFFLSSCSNLSETPLALSERLGEVDSANYTIEITASFPKTEEEFTLGYTYERDGESRGTVILPDIVSGVSFSVRDDLATLEFDGMRLETGRFSESGISPFTVPARLMDSWKNFESVEKTRIFSKNALLAISRNGALETRTWFSEDETLPLYAELYTNGERIIQCNFKGAEHKTT